MVSYPYKRTNAHGRRTGHGEKDKILSGRCGCAAGDLSQGRRGQADASRGRGEHGEAARQVGISRSAFYKYRDSVQPFNDMKTGRIITFYALLKDNPGVLSNVLSIFAGSGANILTINQSIPTNGCAAVTISAETSDMRESLEELIASAAETAGVVKFEILAG
jgi:chorismate mutase